MNKLPCSWARGRLQIFALVIAVAVVFGNSLSNGFVWDDTGIFINQEPYRNFDLKRILLSSANGLEYLPVRDLTIALDHLLWGQKPFGFHPPPWNPRGGHGSQNAYMTFRQVYVLKIRS